MIKLIACDIDGTLVKKGETTVHPNTLAAISKQLENGKTICFASGRSYRGIRKLFENTDIFDRAYYICNDGSVCIYHGKVLYHKQISIENIIKMSRYSDYSGLPIMYYSDTFSYVLNSTPEFLDKLQLENIDKLDPISGVYDIKAPIYKIGVYGASKEPCVLNPLPFDLRVCYNNCGWIEYTSKFANKGLALSDLQMRLYITKFDTAAFGDGENDIEMFSKSKYTYAGVEGSSALRNSAFGQFDDISDAIKQLQ